MLLGRQDSHLHMQGYLPVGREPDCFPWADGLFALRGADRLHLSSVSREATGKATR